MNTDGESKRIIPILLIMLGIIVLALVFLIVFPAAPSPGAETGKDWKQTTASAAYGPRYDFSSLEFDNKLWVIGGNNGQLMRDVWYSGDGSTWKQATAWAAFPARRHPSAVVFNKKMWVIGGSCDETGSYYCGADVWSSGDGINWTQVTPYAGFYPRQSHTSVVFDGKIWVIGGKTGDLRNDVWYSEDGKNWTQATEHAGFSPRYEHATVVFDNKMWVIGGSNWSPIFDDVWYSSDGVTWTQATEHAEFGKRQGFGAAVFNNRIWIIAGFDTDPRNPGIKDDVWYSEDGKIWARSTSHGVFSPRSFPSVITHGDKMWMLGGIAPPPGRMSDPAKDYKSDVWYTE